MTRSGIWGEVAGIALAMLIDMSTSGRPSQSPRESVRARACDVLEQLRAAYGAEVDRLLPAWVSRARSADPSVAHAVDAAITDAAAELAAELTEGNRARIHALLSALSMTGADMRDYVVLLVDHRTPEAPEEFLEVHPPLSILHVDDLADELSLEATTVADALDGERAASDVTVVTVTFARLVVDSFTFTFAAVGSA